MLIRVAKSSSCTPSLLLQHTFLRHFSTTKPNNNNNNNNNNDDDNWNDAWETAWLPHDTNNDNFSDSLNLTQETSLPPDTDADTKAFVADMNENWDERRQRKGKENEERLITKVDVYNDNGVGEFKKDDLYSLENVKKDYRLKKQRIHAALWVKEIEKLEEAKLGVDSQNDDIDKLLDSCSQIFDSSSYDVNNLKVPSTSEFKNKPDGWETMSKSEDGSVWEMSQREEDILLQEFERRMAFCKFQIASFIKTHIFSRRRPIDGWKYMIEVIGPNAKKGKGSVSRLPSLADPATQAFTQDRQPAVGGRLASPKRR